jgi:spore maturation protein CgeB
MKILYLGRKDGTSLQRILAFRRLGHDVTSLDSFGALESAPFPTHLTRKWVFKAGVFGFEHVVERYVVAQTKGETFDMVFVDHGELLGPAAIEELRKIGKIVVNYNQDNPYVPRDGLRWRLFLKALPRYDLIATHRISSANSATRAGARRVLLVREAADEVVHRPIEMSEEDLLRFSSKVAFVGTWMPERGPFMLRLVERGLPLRIYGGRWKKAPEYRKLQSIIVLGNLGGDDYVKAVRGASIAIGLLSKGNEDLHTTRSLEIPAIGTLFCAERTSDHLAMYEEGEEAIFFDSPDECADLCLSLLGQPDRTAKIAEAGRKRVRQNGDFNENLLTRIVNAALTDQPCPGSKEEEVVGVNDLNE